MIRLALRVRRAHAELVLADLLELAPAGVEEVELPGTDGGEGIVEYAVYGAPGELPELPALQAVAAGSLVEVSTSEVPDDWLERWKQFHRPVLIEAPGAGPDEGADPLVADHGADALVAGQGADALVAGQGADARGADALAAGAARARACARVASLHVRPPWEAPSDRLDVREIVIDPAQAFGTGAHATTRLCLELLLELAATDHTRGAVLDVGAGSGVLAIAAAALGYGPVLALDNDGESVLATAANAAVNGVEVDARHFDLRREALPWLDGFVGGGEGAPAVLSAPPSRDRRDDEAGQTVVLANLLHPLLLDLASTMTAPPAHLIASGLLVGEVDEVAQAFSERLGLRERARRERGEWAALWLTRD